jgi:hypothetical protein
MKETGKTNRVLFALALVAFLVAGCGIRRKETPTLTTKEGVYTM